MYQGWRRFYFFTARHCGRRHDVFRLSVRRGRSFVRSDIANTISHERLEQSRWNWRRIFTSP